MRFAVLGAGAIGAYVGAALARGGADVVADRARRAPARRCRSDGVRVLSPRGDFQRARRRRRTMLDAVRDADVVFIGLKAYSLPALAPQARRAARAGGSS